MPQWAIKRASSHLQHHQGLIHAKPHMEDTNNFDHQFHFIGGPVPTSAVMISSSLIYNKSSIQLQLFSDKLGLIKEQHLNVQDFRSVS